MRWQRDSAVAGCDFPRWDRCLFALLVVLMLASSYLIHQRLALRHFWLIFLIVLLPPVWLCHYSSAPSHSPTLPLPYTFVLLCFHTQIRPCFPLTVICFSLFVMISCLPSHSTSSQLSFPLFSLYLLFLLLSLPSSCLPSTSIFSLLPSALCFYLPLFSLLLSANLSISSSTPVSGLMLTDAQVSEGMANVSVWLNTTFEGAGRQSPETHCRNGWKGVFRSTGDLTQCCARN